MKHTENSLFDLGTVCIHEKFDGAFKIASGIVFFSHDSFKLHEFSPPKKIKHLGQQNCVDTIFEAAQNRKTELYNCFCMLVENSRETNGLDPLQMMGFQARNLLCRLLHFQVDQPC